MGVILFHPYLSNTHINIHEWVKWDDSERIKSYGSPRKTSTSTNPARKRCITVSAEGKAGKWIRRMRSVVRQQTSHKSWAGVNVASGCKSEPPLRYYFSSAAFIISAIKLAPPPAIAHHHFTAQLPAGLIAARLTDAINVAPSTNG